MSYIEYYKGFLIEIRKDSTLPSPYFWVFRIRIDFDQWLRQGAIGTDFETAQRTARYEVMAYIALEKLPEPNFRIGQSVLVSTEQGTGEDRISDSTWHRGEQLWYYRGQGQTWFPETQLAPRDQRSLKGKML
ncbi:MAG: hypothetical protein ACFB4I_23875 [Cyanophyceae cyanobacterium]